MLVIVKRHIKNSNLCVKIINDDIFLFQTIQNLLRDMAALEAHKFKNQTEKEACYIYHRYLNEFVFRYP